MKILRYRDRDSDHSLIERIKDHLLFGLLLIIAVVLLLFVGEGRKVFSGGHLATYQRIISNFTTIVTDKLNSINKLSQLRAEYQALLQLVTIQEVIRVDSTSNLNQLSALREVIGFQEELSFESIVAEIIAKDPNQYYSSFIINKGSNDAITPDMVVVAIQQGRVGLVGKIRSVNRNSAIIQTILDEQSFVTTKIVKNQLNGITRGLRNAPNSLPGQVISMQFIDSRGTEEVGFGDLIVTSGFSSVYYPEIPVGTVVEVRAKNYEQTLQIDIEPAINFNRLQYVFVLIPHSF